MADPRIVDMRDTLTPEEIVALVHHEQVQHPKPDDPSRDRPRKAR